MLKTLQANLKLRSGALMPQVGLGTYMMHGSDVHKAVKLALTLGYRLIDTALMYKNEDMIRVGLASFDRSAVFLTSKIPPGEYGFKSTRTAGLRIIANLRTTYLDLLLLQSPGAAGLQPQDSRNKVLRKEAWKALELLHTEGQVRHLGVCNFSKTHLQDLFNYCVVKPSVNQLEVHPLNWNPELLEFCAANSIVVQASAPLARGSPQLLESPKLLEIANKLKLAPSQIALKWTVQKGIGILPKTINPNRIKLNASLDFILSEEDERVIDTLNVGYKTIWAGDDVV